MVPRAGVEPAQYFYRGILSPLRLPISPPGQAANKMFKLGLLKAKYELFLVFFYQVVQ